ncbi:MAG: TrkH family potassium uptake protein [Cyclobacteriaceae bacterium]|nr:TrkH family potassium uptake protein [Cyclobacteriaceae bacterium]
MSFNFRTIIHILGMLLFFNGLFMFMCLPWAFIYHEPWAYLVLSGSITVAMGFILFQFGKKTQNKELKKKDGYLIVTLGWLTMSLFGTIPYLLSGGIPDFTNAFFETISGFTTTGASILNDIESLPKALLFWRSLTQWIGGMGIIVLAVAILPLLGIGGMQLFVAEAPGITPDKLKPRIKDTAKRLWLLYLFLTLSECLLLWFGGMSFFDAINHALTTMATGGFSTKQDSIAHWNSPFIHYVIVVFMFLAGTNFTITYFALKGKLKKVIGNEEFRNYLKLTLIATLFGAVYIFFSTWDHPEKSFRESLFQVVSIITTTGYITADYTAWTPVLTTLFFLLMFLGGSAGSTAGGIKIVRHTLLYKNSLLEIKRQLHPSAVLPVRLNHKAINPAIMHNVLAFIMLYLSVFCIGLILMSMTGVSFDTAIGAVATSLGNIGPGLGSVGPVDNFSHISPFGKWLLSFLMLLGRLELFTVLMLFYPGYWRKV